MDVTPPSVASALAALVALALGAVVLRASPRLPLNRTLAIALTLEALLQASSLLPNEGHTLGAAFHELVFLLALPALPWAHLVLVSYLDSPLSRKLGRPRTRRTLVLVGIVMSLAGVIGFLIARPSDGAAWAIPFFVLTMASLIVASVLGLVATISAWRRAPVRTIERERARAVALAFGARDLLVIVAAALAVAVSVGPLAGLEGAIGVVFAASVLVFATLLAYGILRAQVLDIRARLRVGVARGTLAAAFLAAYVAASQLALILVAPQHGTAIGIAAILLLAILFVPLQRLSEKLATATIPPDARPLSQRRVEVYRLALQELGGSPQASDLLAELRTRLGLTQRDHDIIEPMARGVSDALPDVIEPGMRLLGRFTVSEVLGSGSQGRVLRARDEDLERDIVIKVIHWPDDSSEVLAEGRAIARVRHPRVVSVYDVRKAGERMVIMLEHVAGESLAQRVRRGPLSPAELATVARDVADALVAVHDAGIVHGDVKPANILIEKDGRAKLADFGIATLTREPGDATRIGLARPPRATPRYASPEQLRGDALDARSDQYALALTLREAAERVPPALEAWLAQCEAPDPHARFPTTREMAAALDEALAPARVHES